MTHQNTGHFSTMKTANKCPNCGTFLYLGKIVTNQNVSIEEKEHIKFGKWLLLFSLEYAASPSISNNIQIKIYKTIVFLPVVSYGCEI
jgi:ribosomal protein L32